MLPLQAKPRPVVLRSKPREIANVDPVLKDVLRNLVRGQAAWPLFLHGQPGTGKTCAALALLDHLWEWQGQFATATELTSRVMVTFGSREPFDWRPFGPYRDEGCHPSGMPKNNQGSLLVVLDELGTREKVTDTHYETVQRVIDLREGGLPLILISNLTIVGIGRVYDARIASRCEAGTVVELGGSDRRVTAVA
jgi:DNA replication protein DnaC